MLTPENFKNVIDFIAGDNCSTNKKLAEDLGKYCLFFSRFFFPSLHFFHNTQYYNRRRSLWLFFSSSSPSGYGSSGRGREKTRAGAIIQIADSFRPLINKIDSLMGDLKTLKNSSILRSHTTLLPERKNATRWYSLFNMLVKLNRLRQIVSGIDFSDEVSAKIPTPQENA